MIERLYKWLPIFFGCHCRDDRSFHYNGKKFPVCARCTGELAGMFLLGITYWFWKPPLIFSVIICIPLLIDGFAQLITEYESRNWKRFLTGLLFGYGFFFLIFYSLGWMYRYGENIGETLKGIA